MAGIGLSRAVTVVLLDGQEAGYIQVDVPTGRSFVVTTKLLRSGERT